MVLFFYGFLILEFQAFFIKFGFFRFLGKEPPKLSGDEANNYACYCWD